MSTPTQLLLDFEGARVRFQAAAQDLAQAAEALVRAQPEKARVVKSAIGADRKFFNYLVRTLAFAQYGGDFRATYLKVYDQFARSYSSHPALDMEPGERFVDTAERCGQLPLLTSTVKRMLARA